MSEEHLDCGCNVPKLSEILDAQLGTATDEVQQRFNETYITTTEICNTLNVSRTAVFAARQSGYLPHAISLGAGLPMLWERHRVQKFLDAWKVLLDARRASKEPTT